MATAADAWAHGWEALRAGRAADAERLARTLVQSAPDDANGWFLLGAACHTQGRFDEAVECYEHALHRQCELPEVHNNLGAALRALGRPAEAETCFRTAVRLKADFVEAHNNLGAALREQGWPGEAEASHRRALALRPDSIEALSNLGNALLDQSRFTDAEANYRHSLRLQPVQPETLVNLGSALRGQNRLREAADYYGQGLELRPDLPSVHNALGQVYRDLGRPVEAETCFRRAVQLLPDDPDTLNNLGGALRDRGQLDEAETCLRRALALRPDLLEVCVNLGIVLRDQGRATDAEACLREALRQRPSYPEALNHLGVVLRDRLGRPGEAEACYRQALQQKPNLPEALYNLAIALRDLGRHDEAVVSFRRALELRPDFAIAHSGLLQTLHYQSGMTPEKLASAHAEYERVHAAPLRSGWRPFAHDRDPERPLRLGLLSPDFGWHPVGHLLVRAAEALARRPCSVICYSDRIVPADDMTARFRVAASLWRDVAGVSDKQLAEQVRSDGVDVLIDLAGHTGGNRLLVFARRPAPVQCTWLGYEGTTGLRAIDYLIADERLAPMGAEAFFQEQVLRLPGGYVAYDPPANAPNPGPPPALSTGHVTFGCFNNPAKLSQAALAAFAEVLLHEPGSRLVLQYRGLDDPAVAERLREPLAANGVERGRLELRGDSAYSDYLASYRMVDVALDPFPFGGGVTTCDALWMGVPVVTLAGITFASRHGASYLSSMGLDEFVATDVDGYVSCAAALARNPSRLAEVRSGLRQCMLRSPLCDGDRLADELLAALRGAWVAWTVSGP